MPIWQPDNMSAEPDIAQMLGEPVGSFLSSLVIVLVEGDVDGTAWLIGKLSKLSRRQLRADGASGVAETGLPQDGQVEQSFDQDHGGESADRLPGEQSAFRSWQQTMGERRADATAVEVDDLALLVTGKDDAPAEGIAAMVIDQSDLQQQIEITAAEGKMAPQVSAGSVTDAQFFDQGGIAQSAVFQIVCGLRMKVELKPVEGGRLLQQLGNWSGRYFLFEKRHGLAERQIEKELDEADQVAAPAAAVAVEQILGGVDVERRASLLV
jgi:hypothetical protein